MILGSYKKILGVEENVGEIAKIISHKFKYEADFEVYIVAQLIWDYIYRINRGNETQIFDKDLKDAVATYERTAAAAKEGSITSQRYLKNMVDKALDTVKYLKSK